MKALAEYIARELVENPEAVEVREKYQRGRLRLEMRVAKPDMGRIIGKHGRVANAIRVLLRVAGERRGKRVTLDILEP